MKCDSAISYIFSKIEKVSKTIIQFKIIMEYFFFSKQKTTTTKTRNRNSFAHPPDFNPRICFRRRLFEFDVSPPFGASSSINFIKISQINLISYVIWRLAIEFIGVDTKIWFICLFLSSLLGCSKRQYTNRPIAFFHKRLSLSLSDCEFRRLPWKIERTRWYADRRGWKEKNEMSESLAF